MPDSVHSAAPQNEQGSQSEGIALSTAAPSAEGSDLWIPVSERLPEAGRTVLAFYLNSLGNGRRIRAAWVPAKSEEASPEQDYADYDEDTDTYYSPEGWYEQIDNWGDFTAVAVVEGTVTYWTPLPPEPGQVARPTASAQRSHCEPCQKGAEPSEQGPASPSPYIHRSNP